MSLNDKIMFFKFYCLVFSTHSKDKTKELIVLGHVMRREKLENIVTMDKSEGRRGRGRPRERMLGGLAWKEISKMTLSGMSGTEICGRARQPKPSCMAHDDDDFSLSNAGLH